MGGILSSTLLTLLVIPVIYTVAYRIKVESPGFNNMEIPPSVERASGQDEQREHQEHTEGHGGKRT
jgi:hypothetical protein